MMYSNQSFSNYPHYIKTKNKSFESYDLNELLNWYKEIGFPPDLLSKLSKIDINYINDFLNNPTNNQSNELFELSNIITMLIGFFNIERITEDILKSLNESYNIDCQVIEKYCNKNPNELLEYARYLDKDIDSNSVAFFKLILLFTRIQFLKQSSNL